MKSTCITVALHHTDLFTDHRGAAQHPAVSCQGLLSGGVLLRRVTNTVHWVGHSW